MFTTLVAAKFHRTRGPVVRSRVVTEVGGCAQDLRTPDGRPSPGGISDKGNVVPASSSQDGGEHCTCQAGSIAKNRYHGRAFAGGSSTLRNSFVDSLWWCLQQTLGTTSLGEFDHLRIGGNHDHLIDLWASRASGEDIPGECSGQGW